MKDLKQRIFVWWATQKPEHKNYYKVGAALAGIILLAWVGVGSFKGRGPARIDDSNSQTGLQFDNSANVGEKAMAQKVDALTTQMEQMRRLVLENSGLTKEQIRAAIDSGKPVQDAGAGQTGVLPALALYQKQAAQAPVKLLFPLMLFIMPVVFIVLFGPLLLRLMQGGL